MFRFCFFIVTLLSSNLSLASAPKCPATTHSEPRLVDYSWMSLDNWYRQHADDIEVANSGKNVEVLFLGDSITAAWPYDLWQTFEQQFNAANFAIGGDTTHNVLWRLAHSNAGKLNPKVINLLIGVNNMGLAQQSPEQTYCGIVSLVDAVENQFPNAKILVNQLLPWGEYPDNHLRHKVNAVNKLLNQHVFTSNISLLPFGKELLDDSGRIPKSIMADFLHPTPAGYKIYAKHLVPELLRLKDQ